jgi:hypothetical protein
MPGCFLKDRREVIIAGFDPTGGIGMLKVNLQTGKNESINYGQFTGGINLLAELSPDGTRIATMRTLGIGKLLNAQMRLVSVETGKAEDLGNPGRIGAPFSWLPDGEGLILKRYDEKQDLHAIEPRILCKLGLDGKLTDVRPGDWPVVLRRSRKILYEDNDTRLWHTCELDGSRPELFADGLKGYAMPAVAPDEKKIIFAYYEKGRLPQLMLFDLGKSKGKAVLQGEGFTSTPVWR